MTLYVIMAQKRGSGAWEPIPAMDPHGVGLIEPPIPMMFETKREARRFAERTLTAGSWRVEPITEPQLQAIRDYLAREPKDDPPEPRTMPVPLDPELIKAIDTYAKKTNQAPKDAIAELVRIGLSAIAATVMAGNLMRDRAKDQ